MAQLQAIIVIAGAMLLFTYIAFSLKGPESMGVRWIKQMFFLLAFLMVPVLVFVSMLVADINNLTALSSILEKIYSALIILYVFMVFFFLIKYLIYMFNLFSIKKQREVDDDDF